MTDKLFSPGKIGALQLANRLIRSATAERFSDEDGYPDTRYSDMYIKLTEGGVGLIITGHMFIHPSGKANYEMAAVYDDRFIPRLAQVAEEVHRAGGKIVAQINHGGMQSNPKVVPETIAPSAFNAEYLAQPARQMTPFEIESMIQAFGDAARRIQTAGFDGVQIHSAHGYLISEFLSPLINRREDQWGGSPENRMRFLTEVCRIVRASVGPQFPVLIKLGMADNVEGGLTIEEGAALVAHLEEWGLDGVEISGGISGMNIGSFNNRTGIRAGENEAYFRTFGQKARAKTRLPLSLVGGFRTRAVMEEVLASGDADYISLCRPLICEPDFPKRMQLGEQIRSRCISTNLCFPTDVGMGVSCRCKIKPRL